MWRNWAELGGTGGFPAEMQGWYAAATPSDRVTDTAALIR